MKRIFLMICLVGLASCSTEEVSYQSALETKAKFFLKPKVIDFVNNAINVVRQLISHLGNLCVKINQSAGTSDTLSLFGDRKAPSLERLQ